MYKVGDTITYLTYGGTRRKIKVIGVEEDIKNGEPGFDGVVLEGPEKGDEVWGYDDQIVTR
jgi:hypothetical protein